jgi:hypothetical protein
MYIDNQPWVPVGGGECDTTSGGYSVRTPSASSATAQHAAGAVTDELVEDPREFRTLGLVLDYPQHWRLLPPGASNVGITN